MKDISDRIHGQSYKNSKILAHQGVTRFNTQPTAFDSTNPLTKQNVREKNGKKAKVAFFGK